MTDESPRSMTSSMDTTASPPGSLSSSPESGLGQEKSRQRFADPSNESHSSSGGRVYSPDNLPFNLSHIKKTPRIVLGNRFRKQQSGLTPASELKKRSQKDVTMESEKSLATKVEEMISMRLFYLGIIKDLADVNRKGQEASSPPSVNRNFKTLKRRKEDLIHELNVVKGLIHESERRMVGLAQHINNLALEINQVKALTREEESWQLQLVSSERSGDSSDQ